MNVNLGKYLKRSLAFKGSGRTIMQVPVIDPPAIAIIDNSLHIQNGKIVKKRSKYLFFHTNLNAAHEKVPLLVYCVEKTWENLVSICSVHKSLYLKSNWILIDINIPTCPGVLWKTCQKAKIRKFLLVSKKSDKFSFVLSYNGFYLRSGFWPSRSMAQWRITWTHWAMAVRCQITYRAHWSASHEFYDKIIVAYDLRVSMYKASNISSPLLNAQ